MSLFFLTVMVVALVIANRDDRGPACCGTCQRDGQLMRAVLSVLVFAALTACGNDGGRLSVEEGVACAREAFKGHAGTFSQHENTIRYSYKSPSGEPTSL